MATLEADNFLEFVRHSINDVGATITLRKSSNDNYDITTGTVTPVTADYTIKGLIESYSEYFMRDGLVEMGDRKITIAAAAIAVRPEQGDSVIIEDIVYNVINVAAEFATDSPILFILQIRK